MGSLLQYRSSKSAIVRVKRSRRCRIAVRRLIRSLTRVHLEAERTALRSIVDDGDQPKLSSPRKVKISKPLAVTISVCSHWAESL